MSKKLLLAVFLLFPSFVFAGSFNISLGGGFIPKSGEYPSWYYQEHSSMSRLNEPDKINNLVGTLKGTFSFGRFEIGAGFEMGSMQQKGKITTPTWISGDETALYCSNFYGPNVFGNINFPLHKKFSLYTGVTVGMLFSRYTLGHGTYMMTEQLFREDFKNVGMYYSSQPKNIFAGIQAGLRYKFSNRFAAYGEVAPRFAFNGLDRYPYYKYNIFYFPINLGISCRVSKQ